jgi:predicted CopG family antitoxin
MSDSDRYTTLSVHKGLKEDLQRLKQDDESYNDLLHRAIANLRKKEDRQKSRWEYQDARMAEQSRLLVRMADEMGLDKEQIPRQMAEAEVFGKRGSLKELFAEPKEQISDVYAEEKAARMQAHEEIVGEDGRVGQETEEKIEERAREILADKATDDEGYIDSFDNGGDH